METYIVYLPNEVRKPRRKKGLSILRSLYRQDKTVAHTTVGGVGVVGRLRKRKRGKR